MPIIISHGLPKSGSSFCFQVLHTASSIENKILGFKGKFYSHDGLIDRYHLNYTHDEIFKSFQIYQKSMMRDNEYIIYKTHKPPTDYIKKEIIEGRINAISTIRNPFDVALSLIDAGKRDRVLNKKNFFTTIFNLEDTIEAVKEGFQNSIQWCGLNVDLIPYSFLSYNKEKFIIFLLKKFNLSKHSSIVFDKLKSDEKIHQYNKGINNRWRKELPQTKIDYLESIFKKEMDLYNSIEEKFFSKNKLSIVYNMIKSDM